MLPRAAAAAALLVARAGGRGGRGFGEAGGSRVSAARLLLQLSALDRPAAGVAPIRSDSPQRPLCARAAGGGRAQERQAQRRASRRARRAALVASGAVPPLRQEAGRFVDALYLEAVGGPGGGGSSALFGRSGHHPRAAGGHGGRGGDVVLRAAGGGAGAGGGGRLGLAAVPTRVMGGAGGPGGKQWRQGAAGRPEVVEVPLGTRVWELVPDLAAGTMTEGEEGEDEEEQEEDDDDDDEDDSEQGGSDSDGDAESSSSSSWSEEEEEEEDEYDEYDDDEDAANPPLPAGDALVRALASGAVPLTPALKARLWTRRRLPLSLFSPSSSSAAAGASAPPPPSPSASTCVSFTRLQALEALEAQAPLLAELARPGDEVLASRGGGGGRGSAGRPSKPHGPASRKRDAGGSGQRALLLLRTRLLADVALVGAPNAGKSSLLRALCGARAQVAPHAFTTLRPQLGALPRRGEPPPGLLMAAGGSGGGGDDGGGEGEEDEEEDGGEVVTLADVPGLLKGAHEGRGRGIAFLAPLQRASVLAFVVDLSGGGGSGGLEAPETGSAAADAAAGAAGTDAAEAEAAEAAAAEAAAARVGAVPDPPERQLRVLIDEVRRFDPGLLGEPVGGRGEAAMGQGRAAAIVVANKTDAVPGGLAGAREALRALLRAAPPGWPVVPVSAVEGAGLPALSEALRSLVLMRRRRRRREEEGGA